MKLKEIINIVVAIFALTIFFIATAPRLFANTLTTSRGSYNPNEITYQLNIPCAINKTKIIVPTNNLNYDGPYKSFCNSNAYFNEETESYHLKKNEGYYLDLEILPETNKKIDLSKIEAITLDFYNQNNEKACFTRKLTKNPTEENLYVGKISYVKGNDTKEFALENMVGFIDSCGMDTPIRFEIEIESTNEKFTSKNVGKIKYLVIDSDNSNIVAEKARVQKQVQARNTKPDLETKNIFQKRETINTQNQAQISRQLTIQNNELYITKENKMKKIMPIRQMLQENKINITKVVGDINLETISDVPTYVFEVKEQRKLFGFIPIGQKITQKRISAIKEIKD